MLEAGNNAGMSFDVGPYMKRWLEDAGFINVKERRFCCTIGKWSNDAWERDVGVWEQRKINRTTFISFFDRVVAVELSGG